MLRVEQMTDYSLVALAALRRSPRPLSSPALAIGTGLPLAVASRVLKGLVGAGFATSRKGRSGGYAAADLPGLTVLEVVEAIEGPVRVAACVGEAPSCRVRATCPSRGRWGEINERVRSALAGVSVDDFCGPAIAAADFVRRDLPTKGETACSC